MNRIALGLGAALLATTALTAAAQAGDIVRVATVPLEAEITGMYITEAGDFFFNVQHPGDGNPAPYNMAAVGAITGTDFNALPKMIKEHGVPSGDAKGKILSSLGSYQIIGSEGGLREHFPAGLGAILAVDGKTVVKESNDPDFNAFVPTTADSSEGYLFTNWEDRPGGTSRMHIAKGADGKWMVKKDGNMMVDFSSVNGTWVNCFGSLSPWGTPLTSEELYFDNTADWNNPGYKRHKDQLKLADYLGHFPNPYDYGYIVELKDPKGEVVPQKRFAMGRYSHENAVVMPDRKTAYLSDDGTGVVFFKFVADQAGDLSSGTLYAAKVTQDAGTKDPAKAGFDISWIELGHGDDATIESWVRQYDGITPIHYKQGSSSYLSDAEINAWAMGKADDNRAVFLETRKAAAAKGATAEFRKMEGVMINQAGAANGTVPYMYMAMSAIGKTMSDDKGDVQLNANKCGVVYQMNLDKGFNVHRMVPVVAGHGYNKANKPNACPTDSISNPDNLLVLNDGRVLIGEDTGSHENNMLWIYTPKSP
ncbi:PhoX family phosphatase [Magnetospira sp. QH-2]|uniref:PhoX family protein n=1 Tax=Magnetospira sp. (strain QH-2) TaxID=1288970 RepID=UPI0003E80EC2|nr:alkaline phosphatase PhoX [Magnetospira sp. QH-2]CCQ74278.1 Conserved exported protein of unknown function [Magnetospira sp. QH-2]